jgi:isopenicillin N synthase-like dioxygenase
LEKFQIRTIDFQSDEAPLKLAKSLRNTGFAVIHNHGIDKDLINNVYEEWSIFFKSNKKFDYLFDIEKQDGYFPMKSENAKGYNTKDLKEFYHIYIPWGRIPNEYICDKIL